MADVEVYAFVIFYSRSGKSLTDNEEITLKNVDEYSPRPENRAAAIKELHNFGFKTYPVGLPFAVVIRSTKEHFEHVWRTTLEERIDSSPEKSGYLVQNEPEIPKTLAKYVERVTFEELPQFSRYF